jgi:hypothetical protein
MTRTFDKLPGFGGSGEPRKTRDLQNRIVIYQRDTIPADTSHVNPED